MAACKTPRVSGTVAVQVEHGTPIEAQEGSAEPEFLTVLSSIRPHSNQYVTLLHPKKSTQTLKKEPWKKRFLVWNLYITLFNFKFPFPYFAGVTNFLDINQLTEILLVEDSTAPPGMCTKPWFYNGNKLPFPQPSWFAGFFLPKPYRCLDEVDG